MSQELNDAFRENPQNFLKHHLIINNRLETVSPLVRLPANVLINFEYILGDRSNPVIAKRLTKWRGKLKDLATVEIQACYFQSNSRRGNFRPTQQNTGFRICYVPYSESTGHYRTLGQNVDFVFTHTLSGCGIYTSTPNTSPFRMLHMSGEASDQTIQRKVSECYGQTSYRMIGEQQYATYKGKVAENVNLIGIRNSQNNWDFYAQGYDGACAIASKYRTKPNSDNMTHLSFFTSEKITNWITSNEIG